MDTSLYAMALASVIRITNQRHCLMKNGFFCTVKILNIGTCMSEQTVKILIRLLLRSSLIRIYTVCHSFYIFWRHYFIVKLKCFIFRKTTVAGLGVPIFRVFTVLSVFYKRHIFKKNLLAMQITESKIIKHLTTY